MTSAEQVSTPLAQAQLLVSKSWEHGVFCETLLEVMNAELSVFAPNGVDPFPDGQLPKLGKVDLEKCSALRWASSDGVGMRQFVESGTAELVRRRRGNGMQKFFLCPHCFLGMFSGVLLINLVHIDAASDPASLGISALLIGTYNHDYHVGSHVSNSRVAIIKNRTKELN